MDKPKSYLEWHKGAPQVFNVNFNEMPELLAAGTTLDPDATPTVALERLVAEYPEEWEDISDEVTIATPGVVDAIEKSGHLLMTNGAVQFRLAAESRAEAPLPGDSYSFLIFAPRADDPTLSVAARAWLRIMP